MNRFLTATSDWINTQETNLAGGVINGVNDTATALTTPWRWFASQMLDSYPTGANPNGQLTFSNHAGDPVMAP